VRIETCGHGKRAKANDRGIAIPAVGSQVDRKLFLGNAPLGDMKLLAPVPRPTTNFAPIWLMQSLGYAEDEGLGLSLKLAGTPKDAADGVISGEGDTTFINVVFTILARDRGIPLRPYYAFVRTQNRAFSVPVDSPELFAFARAALVGAGVDPDRDVTFKTLPGTPLDAPRMAAAIRDGLVHAVWQLDVLGGLTEAEGVPLRLLPSPSIDRLTPSSCLNALDDRLQTRPAAYAALGRALAKATLFCLTSPEHAAELVWRNYPDAAPPPGQDKDRAFRGELAALRARLAGHRIESAPIAKWGAITGPEMAAWQEFLLGTAAIRRRRDPCAYYSDELVEAFNAFDPAPVVARALAPEGTIGSRTQNL
jgi:NitT/TauT family transport system substrate-binding protein